MKLPDAKAVVDKEWEKLEKWHLTKVRSKKEVIQEAQKEGQFILLRWWTYVVLRGDMVKDDSGASAVFTGQGSSASQVTAAKAMDVIARLPDCDGQAADAVSAYTQVLMEDAPKLLKIQKSQCSDIWIRLPRHKWPKSWSNSEDLVVLLETKSAWTPTCRPIEDETVRGSFNGTWMEKSTELGMFVGAPSARSILVGIRGWHQSLLERSKISVPCGNNWWNTLIWESLRRFLITSRWDASNANVNRVEVWLTNTENVPIAKSLQEQLKIYLNRRQKVWTSLRGRTTWKGMQRDALNGVANWQTKQSSKCIRCPHHVLTTTSSKRKNWKRWETFSKSALKSSWKCLYLARIGRPDILWSVNKLTRAVTKWTRACDRRLARLIAYIHHTKDHQQYCDVETLLSIADGYCSTSPIELGILMIQNRLREVFYVSSRVERSFPQVGCPRNKLKFHTVLLNRKLFLWMQTFAWTVFPLLISGIEWLKYLHCSSNQPKAPGNLLGGKHWEKRSNERTKKQSNTSEDFGWTTDYDTSNAKPYRFDAFFFEANVAVIKMIIKGSSFDDETRIQKPQSCVKWLFD